MPRAIGGRRPPIACRRVVLVALAPVKLSTHGAWECVLVDCANKSTFSGWLFGSWQLCCWESPEPEEKERATPGTPMQNCGEPGCCAGPNESAPPQRGHAHPERQRNKREHRREKQRWCSTRRGARARGEPQEMLRKKKEREVLQMKHRDLLEDETQAANQGRLGHLTCKICAVAQVVIHRFKLPP